MVCAADGQCEGVGGVFGFRWVWEAQERLDHFLNLVFAGVSGAYDGKFGFFWSEFVNGDRFAGGCEVDHPFGHAEFDSALGVFKDKLRFDGNGGRLVALNEGFNAIENDFVAFGKREGSGRFDATEVEGMSFFIDDSVACDSSSGVNAENDFFIYHVIKLNDPILFEKGQKSVRRKFKFDR